MNPWEEYLAALIRGERPEAPPPATISAAPESVVMSGLREHAPGIAGLIDQGRRSMRPVPGPNPFAAAAGLLDTENPMAVLGGPKLPGGMEAMVGRAAPEIAGSSPAHAMIARALSGGLFGALNPGEDESRTDSALKMAGTRALLGSARGLLGAR